MYVTNIRRMKFIIYRIQSSDTHKKKIIVQIEKIKHTNTRISWKRYEEQKSHPQFTTSIYETHNNNIAY
jgi:hypothetical protein